MTRRVIIDGREIPGVVAVDPDRCLALVHELDRKGNPISDGKGGYLTVRRAGKIRIIDDADDQRDKSA